MAQRNEWDSLVNVYQSHKRNSMLQKQNELQKKQNRELEKQRILQEQEHQANERHRKNLEDIENKRLELLNQQFEHEKNIQNQRKKIFALSKKIKKVKEAITIEEKYQLYNSIEKDYILINADIVPDLDYQLMYDEIKTYRRELRKDIRKTLGSEVANAAFSWQENVEILRRYKNLQKIDSFDDYDLLQCSLHNIRLVYEAIPSVQDSQTEALIAETNVISNDFQTKTGNLCYLNKWLESLNICENIKAGFVSLLCRKCGVSLSFFAQSIQMQAIELTEDQWNDIAFYLKPYFFDLALPADKYQEIQRIYDSLVTLAAVEPQNIEEYYQSKKEIQISKIRETCTRCTIKPLKICDDYQNNDLIAYSVDKSFFIFSDKIEIRKKTKTKTISLSELCQLKDLADIPGEYHSPIIDIIGAFNPDNATELLKKNQNQCSVGCGCCLCILLVVLFWILKLPWWTWIIGLIVAMLVPQLFTFPKTKEKIQSFKNKQSIDYISYDKGWLDFEKGIVRTEKDITNVR